MLNEKGGSLLLRCKDGTRHMLLCCSSVMTLSLGIFITISLRVAHLRSLSSSEPQKRPPQVIGNIQSVYRE